MLRSRSYNWRIHLNKQEVNFERRTRPTPRAHDAADGRKSRREELRLLQRHQQHDRHRGVALRLKRTAGMRNRSADDWKAKEELSGWEGKWRQLGVDVVPVVPTDGEPNRWGKVPCCALSVRSESLSLVSGAHLSLPAFHIVSKMGECVYF